MFIQMLYELIIKYFTENLPAINQHKTEFLTILRNKDNNAEMFIMILWKAMLLVWHIL